MTEMRITSPQGESYERACRLYGGSFPLYEQRLPQDQVSVLQAGDFHFTTLWEGEIFCGILLHWDTPDFVYVEHFAIDPDLRGGGYGTAALQRLCAQDTPVILEIDPPVDELSCKRLHFYERLGFVQNEFEHIHPPYRPGFAGHALRVLSYPDGLTPALYAGFARYLRDVVMAHGR